MNPELLSKYPFVFQHKLAWGEMDAFRHINNTQYFRYFENARIAHFKRLGIMKLMDDINVGPILSETSCRYKSPLVYPDDIYVGAYIRALSLDTFEHVYVIVSSDQNRVVAEGLGKIVYYDYNQNKRCNIPDSLIPVLESDTR